MWLRSVGFGLLQLVLAGIAGSQEAVRYVSNHIPARRDVFIVAHQDDWQLFMGDVVAKQIKAGDSVTFIYLTAGDDGRDSLYWQTRERAALQSTRLATGVSPADSTAASCSTTQMLEHAIRKCMIGRTESYFLRLPDGRRDGAGFARHNFQSLRKLRGKKITAIAAIDGSATYRGWEDLMATAGKLIQPGDANEGRVDTASAAREYLIHASDPSIAANPHDHFDHRMAGLLVADLRKRERWKNTQYYTGYALATRAANRSSDQAREKTAIFLAYDHEMMRVDKTWSAYKEHPAFYSQCMLRTYARTAPLPRKR
jgi:LmbE family N-acetylglucosaminyl deacetylase